MPIDGCEHAYHELVSEVLPRYMNVLRERMRNPIPMADFAVKGVGPVTLQRRLGLIRDPGGSYVILDEGNPIYVGISRGLIRRLRDHVLGHDHLVATLAYRIAATMHPHGNTASLAMRNPDFQMRFQESRDYLIRLSTAFVEIANPLELYLFVQNDVASTGVANQA